MKHFRRVGLFWFVIGGDTIQPIMEERRSGRLLHDGGNMWLLLPSQQNRKQRQGGKQGLAVNLKAYPSDLLSPKAPQSGDCVQIHKYIGHISC